MGEVERMFRAVRALEAAEEQRDHDFEVWERTFRAAAKADDYAIFRDHLQRLKLPDDPLLLLEGTIHFVVIWAACFSLGRKESFARLLKMQTYDPAQSTARYVFTFDLHVGAYARVLVDTAHGNLDLVDMNECPWYAYKKMGYTRFCISRKMLAKKRGDLLKTTSVGFRRFCITHVDWSPLTQEEREQLEQEIEGDLYFDYSRRELEVAFDDNYNDDVYETCLLVRLTEIDIEDQADYEDDLSDDQA